MFEQFTTTIDTLGRERTITLCLPDDYATTTTRYPVIYMHDAQNLFDDTTAFGGQSWRIQNHLNRTGFPQAIVVAIDNSAFRLGEYAPFPISDYGRELASNHVIPHAQGIAYIDWLVHGLKPTIDNLYRTLPQSQSTAIVGSSMGGLISLYAGIAYPDVFGNLGVLSPAFWFSKTAMRELLLAHPLPATTRIFMSTGTLEGGGIAHDEDYLIDAIEFKNILTTGDVALEFRIIPHGEHHEIAWEQLTPHWLQLFHINP